MNTHLAPRIFEGIQLTSSLGSIRYLPRRRPLATSTIALVLTCVAFAASAQDKYDKAVASGKAQLAKGDYSKAATAAQDAIHAAPNRYEAPLLAAQSLRLQAVYAKLEDKQRLLDLASENLDKAIILLKQVSVTEDLAKQAAYATHLSAAWRAQADNLHAKAANEYEAAFLVQPGDMNAAFGGMVAFKLMLDYAKAEKFARVLLAGSDKNLIEQAKLELATLRTAPPQVTNAIVAVREFIDRGKVNEAEAKARENLIKMPFVGELHFWLGFALAQRGEVQPAIASFQEAVRQGFNSEPAFVRASEVPALLRSDAFLTLVTDAIGDSGRKAVLDLWDKREAQIRRETRAKVDTFIAAAHEAIGRRNFATARAEARKAKALVPDDTAVSKLLEEIDKEEFLSHVAAVQDALTRKEFALAKAEALKAQQLRPADPEPPRLLQGIDTAERLERVAGFLKEARDALTQKQFEVAASKAKQALDMMPENGEAKALLAEIEQAILRDKMERAEKLIAQARSVYRKDRSGALAALEQALVLIPENAAAFVLKAEIESFWAHVDKLRSRLNGLTPQKTRLSALEAIAELRAIFPDDGELQKLWEQHCSFVNSLGMRFLFVSKPRPTGDRGDNGVARGFFIAQLETTENQWESVMGRNSLYANDKVWNPDGTYYQPGMDHPVVQITAAEVAAFCDKLSAREGKRYRLPTEPEWEYACTAGEPTPQLSNASLTNRAWFFFNCQRDGQNYPHTVGQKQPNAFGLHDMLGNVAEWCAPATAGTNLAEVAVLKGGSWKDPAELCDPKAQQRLAATQREKWAGFRIVFEPQE